MDTNENRPQKAFARAKVIVKISNPCILSVLMLLAITITESVQLVTLALWSMTLILLLVVSPLVYVYLRLRLSHNSGNSRIDPTLFLKGHPIDIMILGVICGLPCWLALKYLDVPSSMANTLVALLIIAVIIALVNIGYRASFHMAGITILVYMSVVIWGLWFLIFAALIPLIAWAKYKIIDHSPLQMALGIALAMAVASLTQFWLA